MVTTKKTKNSDVNNASSNKQNSRVVYLGPDFKTVRHGRVYLNKLPKELEELRKEKPYVNNLILPIADFSKGVKSLEDKTSLIYQSYIRLRKDI